MVATDADGPLDLIGLLARDQLCQGASVPIRPLFMAPLVKNRAVLFCTDRTDSYFRVFVLRVRGAESVVGSS